MIAPLEIEFHNTQPIEEAETCIRQEFAALERFYHRIVSCRVDVELPEHPRRGSLSTVRVDLGVAGAKGTEHVQLHSQHKDVSMAIHAAFNAAHRRVQEFKPPNRYA